VKNDLVASIGLWAIWSVTPAFLSVSDLRDSSQHRPEQANNHAALAPLAFIIRFCYRGYPYSLVLHEYIAFLLHSYSINSVLHLLSPTTRDSYELGYAYCIAKLLKFTHFYLPSLWPLYRSLMLSLHVL
jgi:hypothetical protein